MKEEKNKSHLLQNLHLPIHINSQTTLNFLDDRYLQEFYKIIAEERLYLKKWLPWVEKRHSHKQIQEYFSWTKSFYEKDLGFCLGIFFHEKFVGEIKVSKMDWSNKSAAISYWLSQKYQGKGLATICAQKITSLLFTTLQLHRVYLTCSSHNMASQKVASRLGFKLEDVLAQDRCVDGVFYDTFTYAVLAESWNLNLKR